MGEGKITPVQIMVKSLFKLVTGKFKKGNTVSQELGIYWFNRKNVYVDEK